MANQSDPKTVPLALTCSLVTTLVELQQVYLADLKAGGYAQASVNYARQETDFFIGWLAGKRKVNPRQRVAENVAQLMEAVGG